MVSQSKSTKLANDYYYCQKRPKIAWKSKILGEIQKCGEGENRTIWRGEVI